MSHERNTGDWLIGWDLYENDQFIVDLPIKVVIFHSYVSLPEGIKMGYGKTIYFSLYLFVIFISDMIYG